MEEDIPKDVMRLLERYLERFGDTAPVALRSFSWIRENVKRALEENRPLSESELPPGAVI